MDSENIMNIPNLNMAKQSASYLYDYLRNNEDDGNYIYEATDDAATRYNCWDEIGESIYEE